MHHEPRAKDILLRGDCLQQRSVYLCPPPAVTLIQSVIREMDAIERIITRAVRNSKDGRIDQGDFLNEAAGSMRYSMFTPMEADIIWHFSSRGAVGGSTRLRLADFQALLDPKWQAPQLVQSAETGAAPTQSLLSTVGESVYHFLQGGLAGGLGAFVSLSRVADRFKAEHG